MKPEDGVVEGKGAGGILSGLKRWQKVSLAAAAVLCFGGLLLWSGLSGKDGAMVPLYTGLDLSDSSRVVSYLDENSVNYRLEDGGRTILVPQDQLYSLRIGLAGEGLTPRGGVVGFELFDSSKMGSTDFDRRVDFLRALQGELARTITEMDMVERASVHIVMPEPSVFVRDKRPPTAAVLLKTRSPLGPEQVRAIVNLVAYSVDGLEPAKVTVLDVEGRILSGQGEEGTGFPLTSGRLSAQQEFQKNLEEGLQGLLEQVLGPGNVVARVTAELDFDQRTVESTRFFDPNEDDEYPGLIRSVQTALEQFDGTSDLPRVPADSNITYPSVEPGEERSYYREENVTNFELDQEVTREVVAPGDVKSLSVAVVVNRELDAAQAAVLEDVVKSAIGFTEGRDQVTVTGIPFDTSLSDEISKAIEASKPQEEPAAPEPLITPLMMAIGGSVAALVLFVVVFLIISGRRRRAREEAERLRLQQLRAEQEPAVSAEEREKQRRRQQIQDLARQKPADVAQLIKGWLYEE